MQLGAFRVYNNKPMLTKINNLDQKLTRLINWLFSFLMMVLPFVFCWLSDELFEFNKMLFVYTFAILIGGAFLARMILQKKIIWQPTFLDWPIALFLLSQIISTIFSLHPRTSFLGYYTRLNGGLLSTISYLVLYYAFINNVNKKYRANFLFATFFSGIFISLYAIFEHFGRSFSCLIIKGSFDVSCWIQDVQTRVFASFGQPNWLAAYNIALISLGTPIIIGQLSRLLAQKKQSFAQRLNDWGAKIGMSKFYFFIIVLSVYLNFCALIFTKSRSGILAFFAGLFLILSLQLFSWWRQQRLTKGNFAALALVFFGFLLPALAFGTQYTPDLKNIISKISAQTATNSTLLSTADENTEAVKTFPSNLQPLAQQIPSQLKNLNFSITDSADIRKIVWQGALQIWRAHPLFGTGVETFAYSYYNYRPSAHNWTSEWDFLYNKAHNEFLNYAANSGTFGLLSYLSLFFVFAFFTLHFLLQKKDSPLLIGVSSALLTISITNFFGFSTVTIQVLLFLSFALGIQILAPFNFKKAIEEKNQPLTFSQKINLSVLSLLLIFLLSKNWAYWLADYNYARCKSLATRASIGETLTYCHQAIKISHEKEPLFLADTADFYAQYALALFKKDPTNTLISDIANESLRLSTLALKENPVHLNLYKTRFRTLSTLANLDQNAIIVAQTTLDTALQLAPTDPKLSYFYALLMIKKGDLSSATTWINQALTLRPLYTDARLLAAQIATNQKNYVLAQAHYQFILDYIEPENLAATEEISHLATFSAIISANENN